MQTKREEKKKIEEHEEKQKTHIQKIIKPPKWEHKPDFENIEIKVLDEEDYEDVISILRKNNITLNAELKKEIKHILRVKKSLGCFVERALVGVILAIPVKLNEDFSISEGNSHIVFEEPFISPGFESRNIQESLIEKLYERENKPIITYLEGEINPPTPFIELLKKLKFKLKKVGNGYIAIKG